jgi:small subunit ribosomal protein S9
LGLEEVVFMKATEYYATGRRKNSIARVRLRTGSGKFEVNSQSVIDYFKRETLKMIIEQPFDKTETLGKFDIVADVKGGGLTGQAGALRLGISRALLSFDEELRSILRTNGFLTRDPREKERKKYGLAGARKRFQFSKR